MSTGRKEVIDAVASSAEPTGCERRLETRSFAPGRRGTGGCRETTQGKLPRLPEQAETNRNTVLPAIRAERLGS